MFYYRHDLVYGSWDKISFEDLEHEKFKDLILRGGIPGIVRREDCIVHKVSDNYYNANETVYVGFVYPFKEDGQRIRFASSILGSDVERKYTPFEVAKMEYKKRTNPLSALNLLSKDHDIGVWGSASLEILTKMEYTNESSDLDALYRYESKEDLALLYGSVKELEKEYDMRIDVEVIIPNGYGINLKEYMQSGNTMLAKGLRDVILINRKDIERIHGPTGDDQ